MMAAYDLIPILAKLTDSSESSTETYYRRLNEAELIPRSAGRSRELLDTRHVTLWVFAMLANVPSRAATQAATTYFNLENGVGTKAGDVVVRFMDSFRGAGELLASGAPLDDSDPRTFDVMLALHANTSRVELDCGTPRIRIVADLDGKGDVAEVLYGPQVRPWKDGRVRRTNTIPGSVLKTLGVGLYFNRWPANIANPHEIFKQGI